MFSGEVLFLAGELSGYGNRALAFQESDHRGNCVFGWDHDQHMDVIGHDVAFENRALLLPGKFVKERADRFSDVSVQDLSASLRYEDNMIFAVPF